MWKTIAVAKAAAIGHWELWFAAHETLEIALISPLNLFKLSEVFYKGNSSFAEIDMWRINNTNAETDVKQYCNFVSQPQPGTRPMDKLPYF